MTIRISRGQRRRGNSVITPTGAKAQDFALSLPSASGIGRGTQIIIVETRDHTGRTFSTQLTARVH